MDDKLHLNFSYPFAGVVWNTVAGLQGKVLIIEARSSSDMQVRFSALNFEENLFLWKDRALEEAWWVNASALSAGVVLFTIYLDTNNPDKKGILAYSLTDLSLLWWNNDFSISEICNTEVKGFSSKYGLKEIFLDVQSGKEVNFASARHETKSLVRKPVQYAEGMPYFDTVKSFLADRLNLTAVSALEYLEIDDKIIISCYTGIHGIAGLANYLLVLSNKGDLLLKEVLEENVSGIGLDTFFVLEGFLFFVKNKTELVSYTIL